MAKERLGIIMTNSITPTCQIQVSVILPSYNEANIMENSVERVIAALEELALSYEIMIAEDGSTDGGDKLGDSLAQKFPFVIHLYSKKRLGRGAALKNAFKKSHGNIMIYMDVDLATDLRCLRSLVNAIAVEKYDIAIGSRMLPESRVERSLERHLASQFYNFLVRIVLGSRIKDHQCGFKAFSRQPTLLILDEVSAQHWFFDTEILVRADRKKYRIKELPVYWKSNSKTKVNFIRDSYRMGYAVFDLWWQLRKEHNS